MADSSSVLRATIDQAREGMQLALPVYHPRTAKRLLAEGYRLDQKSIRRLCDLGVVEVWVRYPSTDLIRSFISPAVIQKQTQVLSHVTGVFHALHQNMHAELNFHEYASNIRDLIETLGNEPKAATYVSELAGRVESDFRHAASVAILSLLLGLKLQDYLIQERPRLSPRSAKNVQNLALGAMLHDVGMLKLDPAVRRRLRSEPDEQDPEWRKHPELGFKMMSGDIDASAAAIIFHHHQHFDGTGFPLMHDKYGDDRALQGRDIHIFARIVAVANSYDRLRNPFVGRQLLRVEALRRMIEPPFVSRFDPIIMRTLFKVVPAYAPGAIVTLNSGDRCIVVGWNPGAPCRPTVQRVPSPDERAKRRAGVRPAIVRIDLEAHPELQIVEENGIDVRAENFDLPPFEDGMEYAA